jgi:ubiquinone/menaquinone biosynthesis C-methylase UbiE
MNHKEHIQSLKDYFTQAYVTGTDIWTHIPYQDTAFGFLAQTNLPKDPFVLDIGAGRGRWGLKMVEAGTKVIGIDIVPEIVKKANEEIKHLGKESQIRFVEADVFDIPLADTCFDMATDIGTLQHIPHTFWKNYVAEIDRVLKPRGYYFNVSLSRSTPRFFDILPPTLEEGSISKFGLPYHFFTKHEIRELFEPIFECIDQDVVFFDTKHGPEKQIALVFSLFQK